MKAETRIIPEEVTPRFLAQHLKPYEAISHLVKNKRLLEIGCGDGYGTSYLAEFAAFASGIDYDAATVETAKSKYRKPNLAFFCMDALKLNFPDNAFDFICSFQNIEHIPENDLAVYLSQIKRVLVPSGTFAVTTLNLAHACKKAPLRYRKNPAHCKEFTFKELDALLSDYFLIEKRYGLFQTARHNFFHSLKKSGIFNRFPERLNPVNIFYKNVTTADFKLSDFLMICRNHEK